MMLIFKHANGEKGAWVLAFGRSFRSHNSWTCRISKQLIDLANDQESGLGDRPRDGANAMDSDRPHGIDAAGCMLLRYPAAGDVPSSELVPAGRCIWAKAWR